MKKPLGADLVIPALALGFAIYFFISIADLAWEAKANGVMIGGILVLLIAAQVVRIAIGISKGEASLGRVQWFSSGLILRLRIATGPWSPWMRSGPVAASFSQWAARVGPVTSMFSRMK